MVFKNNAVKYHYKYGFTEAKNTMFDFELCQHRFILTLIFFFHCRVIVYTNLSTFNYSTSHLRVDMSKNAPPSGRTMKFGHQI